MKFLIKDAVARLKIKELYTQVIRNSLALLSVSVATVIISILLIKVDTRLSRIEQNQVTNYTKAQAWRDRYDKRDSINHLNSKK